MNKTVALTTMLVKIHSLIKILSYNNIKEFKLLDICVHKEFKIVINIMYLDSNYISHFRKTYYRRLRSLVTDVIEGPPTALFKTPSKDIFKCVVVLSTFANV